MTHKEYTAQEIKDTKEDIAKLQRKLAYLEAVEYLMHIEETAEVTLCPVLAEHYGETSRRLFKEGEMFATSNPLFYIKIAVSRFKSLADTNKEPSWAAKARKAAKIINEYENGIK